MAIVLDRAMKALQLTRILDQLAKTDDLPKTARADNDKGFYSQAMSIWVHAGEIQLFLIKPGKHNQNAIQNHLTVASGTRA